MRDDSGDTVNDEMVLDRVAAVGAAVVIRGPVESIDFETWRRELRRTARDRKLRLSVRRVDDLIVVSNPDHIVTDEQRAAAVARMAAHPAFQLPPPPPAPAPPQLRVVPPT